MKLRGLPFKAERDDIFKFFDGFEMKKDLVLQRKNPDGRPNGEVRTALKRNLLPYEYSHGQDLPASQSCVHLISSGVCNLREPRRGHPRTLKGKWSQQLLVGLIGLS